MNELELRTHFVDTARSYYGTEKGSARYLEILDIYNSQERLPRDYRMAVGDPWCAAFVSAMAIKCGLTEIIPTECSCREMIRLHKALGTWQEYDGYVPKPGDLLIYDWEDSGKGDNTGEPDHVGIVVRITDGVIRVIEGNLYNAVWHRDMKVDGTRIRGYCVPDFGGLADREVDEMERFHSLEAVPGYARDTIGRLLDRGILKGDEKGDLNLSEDMVRILVILDRAGKL